MSTRIYFPDFIYPPEAFADFPFDAAWEKSATNRLGCSVFKSDSLFAFYTNNKATLDQPYDVGMIQYISEPLAAQTINGTVKGQFRAYQEAGGQFSRALVIRVVSGDGFYIRGTLLSHFPASLTSEWNTSPQNRAFPPAATALTEVVAQEGDRLVIEIGFRSFDNSTSDPREGGIEVGTPPSAGDLPENETETGQECGWLEFSQNLAWIVEPVEFSSSGPIQFYGFGTVEFLPPAVFAGIADGFIEITGEVEMEAAVNPAFEAAASGWIDLAGSGGVEFIPPATPGSKDFAATGWLELKGPGQADFIAPAPPAKVELAAAGFMSLTGQIQVSFEQSLVLAIVAAGWISLGGAGGVTFAGPAVIPVKAFAGSGCLELGGAGAVDFPGLLRAAYAADTGLGSTALLLLSGEITAGFIRPLALEMGAEGEILIEAPGPVEEGVFETYVLTGFRQEPSIYSGFNFNSYARHRGQYYGAKEDGIYLLEGEDDAGAEIHSGVRLSPANFGSERLKRLHLLRLGGECGRARVKVSNGNGTAGYFEVEEGRAAVSREIKGSQFTVEIADFDSLNHLEMAPKLLGRR